MHPPGADTVLVRHGEIGTKSDQVRRSMEGRLRDNLAAALAERDLPGTVERERTRLYLETDHGAVEAVTNVAAATFGVVSASPAVVVPPRVDPIADALADVAADHYDEGSFAVRARRAGSSEVHPFSSRDLEEAGGAAVWRAGEAAGVEPDVDLEDPDHTFHVECRSEAAYVFCEKRPGPGGYPLGVQEPLVALVSGGIDSPVAAYEAMRRGAPVIPLYIDLGDYGGADHRLRAAETVRTLWDYVPGTEPAMLVAPGGDAVDRLVAEMDAARMLGLRRFMYCVAEDVAEARSAVGIVTGEAIGQKSSQTTANMRVTAAATDYPILRPLLSRDKTAITERAREIGTFQDSTISAGCNRVAPSLPETAGTLADIKAAEPADLVDLAAEAAEAAEWVSVSGDGPARSEEARVAGDRSETDDPTNSVGRAREPPADPPPES
ncbi:MAG: tRNA sulfurtransferase [Haloarculaceae archaeon]